MLLWALSKGFQPTLLRCVPECFAVITKGLQIESASLFWRYLKRTSCKQQSKLGASLSHFSLGLHPKTITWGTKVLLRQPCSLHHAHQGKYVTYKSGSHLGSKVPNCTLKWMKDGRVIERSDKYSMTHEGKRAELIIDDAELSDSGEYTVVAMQDNDPTEYYSTSNVTVEGKGRMLPLKKFEGEGVKALNNATVAGELTNALKAPKYFCGCSYSCVFSIFSQDIPVIDPSVLEVLTAHPVTVKAGHTAYIKVPFKGKPLPKVTWFKDGIEVTEEEKVVMEKTSDYATLTIKKCVREDSGNIMIKLKNDCGSAIANMFLNVVDKPKPPQGKVELLERTGKCIKMKWKAPKDNGGKQVTHFIIEKKMVGKKSWIKIGETDSKHTTFATDKVEEGKAYQFRIIAVNAEGLSDPLETEEIFWYRSPSRGYVPPAFTRPQPPCLRTAEAGSAEPSSVPVLGALIEGLEAYAGRLEWTKCSKIPISGTSYTVGGLQERQKYFFRIRAVNEAGVGEPAELEEGVLAMPPPGNLQDILSGIPTKGREIITKGKNHSQFLIHSTKRFDSGVYRILLKNDYGEAHYDIQVHVAGTNLQLVEEVPNTMTLKWDHTPDIMDDGHAHYVIMKRDARTATWFTAAEKVYSNKYTVTALVPGRKYFFRVIARNDIGDSDPLDSKEPWHISKDKERFNGKLREYHERDWRQAPHFIAPLKNHAVHRGQDCTMSCAFLGNPRPVVTLYKGNVNITANSKFWYNSTSGVCTLMIPTCSSKDSGDYTVAIENELGQKKCSCVLTVYVAQLWCCSYPGLPP
uniref:Immunoglobulin superfamily member 22 n=1 Tax=Chelydra serpentina TaxID=8475 RepID=A0A8C3XRJ0_CHESE